MEAPPAMFNYLDPSSGQTSKSGVVSATPQSVTPTAYQRATMAQLRGANTTQEDIELQPPSAGYHPSDGDGESDKKLGWFLGVFVRIFTNIVGVMQYLRISWMAANAGVGLASVCILVTLAVNLVTALSMSAIVTNGEVKGGGAYYFISRSLGPEFGGAIGVVFTLANTVTCSMHLIGNGEIVR